ncbi:CAP1 family protein [Megaselia abdita]
MFSCCRCGNPKTKDGKPSKKSKQKNSKVTSDGEEEDNNTTSPVPTSTSTSPPPDGQQNSSFSSFTSPLTSPVSTGGQEPAKEEVLVNGQVSSSNHHKERLASPLPVDNNSDDKEEQDNNLQSSSLSASSSSGEGEVVGVGDVQEINQAKDITNGIEKMDGRDCDPDIRPTITSDLEHLLNRLENLVERLERSLTAKELALANQTLDSVLETRRRSFDIESAELPPIPEPKPPQTLTNSNSDSFSLRLERIENSLGRLNDSYKRESISENQTNTDAEGSLENIPTVLEDFQVHEPEPIDTMSVLGYQDIVNGPFSQYLALSQKIGGDVAQHSEFVRKAFDAQLQQINLASQISTPPPNKQQEIIKPTADQISAIQEFREKHRASPFFNHLSAISESIPALGWVCVAPTPGPYVKEMNDAGQFYTNRVLKDWKEKDTVHVEWARSWIQTLTDLQQYIKQYHTTGLVWSGKGSAPSGGCPPPPPSAAGCPPPPPPPVLDMSALSFNDASNDDRSALFAEINKGADITKSLKKVTADMQTHKNPTLRTGPAPFVTPNHANGNMNSVGPAKPVKKEPVFNKDGKKWMIEYHENNPNLLVDNTEMNNVIYVFKCVNSTLTVKGKVNNVVFDSCKKCSLLFDSVVSSIEFVNCQSVQMQVLGKVPTISIDKTDGCQMYLSSDSLAVEIVSSKSSEMNVLIPKANGEYTEQPIPEQFKTFIKGNNLQTICVESLG